MVSNIYKIKNITDKEHDNFVKNHKYGDVTQLSAWAKVKAPQWYSKRIALFKEDSLIGVVSILFRKIPKTSWSLCYMPRGFVMDYDSFDAVKFMANAVISVAKAENAFEIKMDPNVPREDGKNLLEWLPKLGFEHNGFNFGMEDSQPRFTMFTDISREASEIINSYAPNARRMVARAEGYKLECRPYNDEYLDVFFKLMQVTGNRDGFLIRDLDYFKKILDNIGSEDSQLYLTSINRSRLLEIKKEEKLSIVNERPELEKKLAKTGSDKKRDNLCREIEILDKRLEACNVAIRRIEDEQATGLPEEIYLSGGIMTYCGQVACYMYGASSNEYRELYPSYLMQWKMMLDAKEKGCTIYDFGGVSGYTEKEKLKNDHMAGLYEFKRMFGSQMYERVGEFNKIQKPFVHKLFKNAMKIRKKLLDIERNN